MRVIAHTLDRLLRNQEAANANADTKEQEEEEEMMHRKELVEIFSCRIGRFAYPQGCGVLLWSSCASAMVGTMEKLVAWHNTGLL